MPLYRTISTECLDDSPSIYVIYIWELVEAVNELREGLDLSVSTRHKLEALKTLTHQEQLLSIRQLLLNCNYKDSDLHYLDTGKPYLSDGSSISITHTSKYTAIAIAKNDIRLGIDIEVQNPKLFNISKRFLHITEHMHVMQFTEDCQKIALLSILWSYKESLYKYYDIKGLSFANQMYCEDFYVEESGVFQAYVILTEDTKPKQHKIYYNFFASDHVITSVIL